MGDDQRLVDHPPAIADVLDLRGILEDAEPDILAFYAFLTHWRKLRSTNPLERFNKEVGRRTDVVGIFPDDRSLVRLAGMLCIEQNDERLVGRGDLSSRRCPSSSRPEPPTCLTEERSAPVLDHLLGLTAGMVNTLTRCT